MDNFEKGEVEPILKVLGNNFKIEKGENGKETIVVYGKEGNIVASFSENMEKFFDVKFQQEFMNIKENVKGLSSKIEYERIDLKQTEAKEGKSKNIKKENNAKQQKESHRENLTNEKIKEELGDEYVVAAEINDEEISKKLIETEDFIGNPLIAFNKSTKEFVLVGNKGDGKLAESNLHRTSTIINVDKYNYDGSIVQEKSINGMILLPPENRDGIDLRINSYGEMEINKIVNARGDNPQMFPVDTKQKIPSSQEISDMKKDREGMEEINEILDNMQEKDIIDESERTELLEDLSTNGKSLEEDKEKLEKIVEEKENSENGTNMDNDEYDPRDPRANDPRWS